ncbi:hypothetical protein ACFYPC_27330 [Streptomyces sp. NPDC005808]
MAARPVGRTRRLHELAQLDEQGHRPLRTVAIDEPGAALYQ